MILSPLPYHRFPVICKLGCPSSAVQKIKKLSETPTTVPIVAKLCIIDSKNRKIAEKLVQPVTPIKVWVSEKCSKKYSKKHSKNFTYSKKDSKK